MLTKEHTGDGRINFGRFFSPHRYEDGDFMVASGAEPVNAQLDSPAGKNFLVAMTVYGHNTLLFLCLFVLFRYFKKKKGQLPNGDVASINDDMP